MAEALTTTERYVLSQLLICGAFSKIEYENVSSEFSRTVRERALSGLREKGYLEQTLYHE